MKKKLHLLLLLFAAFPALSQTVRYVKQGSSGNGTTWATAYGNLQTAINNSAAGDAVYVAKGTYTPAVNTPFSLKEGVMVYGGFPNTGNPALNDRNFAANATVLSANGSVVLLNMGNGITPITNATLLDGFTLTGGTTTNYYGGGIYNVFCHALFRNLIVRNNQAPMGGGIYNFYSDATFINVLVHNNTASGPLSSPTEQNSGGAVGNSSSDAVYINCTFANNTSAARAGTCYNDHSEPEFYNCIMYGNTSPSASAPYFFNQQAVPSYAFSVIQGCGLPDPQVNQMGWNFLIGTNEGNNRDINPLFATNATYQLQPGSWAMNRANAAYYDDEVAGSIDGLGNARIVDQLDMGYAEYPVPAPDILYVRQNGTGNGTSWENASGDLEAMIAFQAGGKQIWVAEGVYQPGPYGNYYYLKEGIKIYGGFAPTGNPVMDNRDPEAYETILKGKGRCTICNTYTEDTPITEASVLDGFTITGSGGGWAGIDNRYASPTLQNLKITKNLGAGINVQTNSHPVITNVTIIDNYIYATGALKIWNGGSATVTNTVFEDNTGPLAEAVIKADAGSDLILNGSTIKRNPEGAIFCDGCTATINNTVIRNNEPGWGVHTIYIRNNAEVNMFSTRISNNTGAGIFIQTGEVNLTNVRVTGNTSQNTVPGVSCYSCQMEVVNSTFANNISNTPASNNQGGGGFLAIGTPSVVNFKNSIFYGNEALYLENMYLYETGQYSFQNCLIGQANNAANWNTWPNSTNLGGNIVDQDPMFTENFGLQEGSPAIDAGSNSLFPATNGMTDLWGNARIYNNVIDLGPYEYNAQDEPEDEVDEVTGIKDIATAAFVVYPNPARDYITVSVTHDVLSTIVLYDITGKEAARYGGSQQIDVSQLPSGIYIMQITTDKAVHNTKLVKL